MSGVHPHWAVSLALQSLDLQPVADDATLCAGRELARQVAPLLGVGEATAYDELTYIPDNLLTLLDSPDGWGAMCGYLAAGLGVPPPAYAPTIH